MSSMHLRVPRTAVVLAVALLLGTGASAQGVYDAIDSDFSSTLNSVNSFLCSVDTAHGKENSVKCRPPPPGAHTFIPFLLRLHVERRRAYWHSTRNSSGRNGVLF